MSSGVCQRLQSSLELRYIESRLLSLKLTPPKTSFPVSSIASIDGSITCNNNVIDDGKPIGNRDINVGGWSFLQSLAADGSSSTQNEKVYVHPLVKRSTSTLSERSLEMCTESLGSETGSDVSETIDDISLLSLENVVYNSKPRDSLARKKNSHVNSFPPPLTSISGSNGVKVVKSHREGGRLVLEAVTIPPCNTYFHTERSQGRLKLSLFKDVDATASFGDNDDEEEDRKEVVEKHDGDGTEVVKGEGRDEKRVKIWKEIAGMSWLKPKTEVKKVGRGSKGCLIGSHCWWNDYLKAKTWKISLNPTGQNYYCYFIP